MDDLWKVLLAVFAAALLVALLAGLRNRSEQRRYTCAACERRTGTLIFGLCLDCRSGVR